MSLMFSPAFISFSEYGKFTQFPPNCLMPISIAERVLIEVSPKRSATVTPSKIRVFSCAMNFAFIAFVAYKISKISSVEYPHSVVICLCFTP